VQEKDSPDQAFTTQSVRRLTLTTGPMTLEVPIKQGLLTSVVISSALAMAEDNGAKKSQTGVVENYATQLRSVPASGTAKRYHLVTKYAGTLFFPYATALSTTSPHVTQEKADVNGVSGIRIRVAKANTASLDVVYAP
jgi:hypothetical protein